MEDWKNLILSSFLVRIHSFRTFRAYAYFQTLVYKHKLFGTIHLSIRQNCIFEKGHFDQITLIDQRQFFVQSGTKSGSPMFHA